MTLRLPTLLTLLIPALTCHAQLRWRKVDSTFGPLPLSIHVYRSPDSLDGLPFIAYYVSARLKDKNLLFTTQTVKDNRFTPSQFYQLEQEPLLVVNATFFSLTTGEDYSLVVRNGRLVSRNLRSLRGTGADSALYYYPTRAAIGIDRRRRADVAWTFTDSVRMWPYAFEDMPVVAKGTDSLPSIFSLNDITWKWWKMRTAVGGGPVLIHDGKVHITNREEQLFPDAPGDYEPRTAMGYTRDGQLIILAIQGRTPGKAAGATLRQEARIMLGLGCYEALNLDGGGSTCLLVNGKETVRPSGPEGERPLPTVFLIKSR
ncbi:MAG TPA: phosphodiester glycosidase family protein [Puia sp.]|nr:phosphodiester glycosidase family protein [Puia sp.]